MERPGVAGGRFSSIVAAQGLDDARCGPLEAHELAHERVVPAVGTIGIADSKPIVEAVVSVGEGLGEVEAKRSKPGLTDRHHERSTLSTQSARSQRPTHASSEPGRSSGWLAHRRRLPAPHCGGD
jgi:hypothetical protein